LQSFAGIELAVATYEAASVSVGPAAQSRCGREPGSSRIAAVRGLPRGPTRDRADGNSQPTPMA